MAITIICPGFVGDLSIFIYIYDALINARDIYMR